jgi:hypothetical protein
VHYRHLDSYFDEFAMTDKEIWELAGVHGEWLNGEVLEITDAGLIEFACAIKKAERDKCADLLKALENMVGMVELNLFDKHVVMSKARQVIKKARGE